MYLSNTPKYIPEVAVWGVPQTCNFIKKRLFLRRFPVNFANFLRTPFLTENLRRLLLSIKYVRKIIRKTNILNLWYAHAHKGAENISFS